MFEHLCFDNLITLKLKNNQLNSKLERYDSFRKGFIFTSIIALICSLVILSILSTFEKEEKSIDQNVEFINYITIALSSITLIASLIFYYYLDDSQIVKNLMSSILQIIICFEIYSFNTFLNWKLEISHSKYRISYLFVFIENFIKFSYIVLVDNYYMRYLISNLIYLLCYFLAEPFIKANGFLNLSFETLFILLISSVIYIYNYKNYYNYVLLDSIKKYFSKPIGNIKINLKEKTKKIDASIFHYLKENNFHVYFEKYSNNSINNLEESRQNDNNNEHNQTSKHIQIDGKAFSFIFQNLEFDSLIESNIRVLYNEFYSAETRWEKERKIYNIFDNIFKFSIKSNTFHGILGSVRLDHTSQLNHPHHKVSQFSNNSNLPLKMIKSKISEESSEAIILNLSYNICKYSNEIDICLVENPSYFSEMKKEQQKFTESLIYLSKITHEFKSPLTSIDILLEKLASELKTINMDSNKLLNKYNNSDFVRRGNIGILTSDENFNIDNDESENKDIQTEKNLNSNLYCFKKNKVAKMLENITKIRSLSNFVIILFKDIEYLTASLSNDTNKIMKNKKSLKFYKSNVELKEVFEFVKNIMETRNQIMSKDIKIKSFFDNTLPKSILTDEIRLKQVLINLISNAIKFTRKGEIKLIFNNIIDSKTKKKYVEFIIQDTGNGIPSSKISELLINNESNIEENDMFMKELSNENKLGSGLGLSIVKDIIKYIGLKFDIESIVNFGTKVSFLIQYDSISPEASQKSNIIVKKTTFDKEQNNNDNTDGLDVLNTSKKNMLELNSIKAVNDLKEKSTKNNDIKNFIEVKDNYSNSSSEDSPDLKSKRKLTKDTYQSFSDINCKFNDKRKYSEKEIQQFNKLVSQDIPNNYNNNIVISNDSINQTSHLYSSRDKPKLNTQDFTLSHLRSERFNSVEHLNEKDGKLTYTPFSKMTFNKIESHPINLKDINSINNSEFASSILDVDSQQNLDGKIFNSSNLSFNKKISNQQNSKISIPSNIKEDFSIIGKNLGKQDFFTLATKRTNEVPSRFINSEIDSIDGSSTIKFNELVNNNDLTCCFDFYKNVACMQKIIEDTEIPAKIRNSYSNTGRLFDKDFDIDNINSYKRLSAQKNIISANKKCSPIKSILMPPSSIRKNSNSKVLAFNEDENSKQKKYFCFKQPTAPTRKSKSTVNITKECLPKVSEVNSDSEPNCEIQEKERTNSPNINIINNFSYNTNNINNNNSSCANTKGIVTKHSKKFHTSKKLLKKIKMPVEGEYLQLNSEKSSDSKQTNNKNKFESSDSDVCNENKDLKKDTNPLLKIKKNLPNNKKYFSYKDLSALLNNIIFINNKNSVINSSLDKEATQLINSSIANINFEEDSQQLINIHRQINKLTSMRSFKNLSPKCNNCSNCNSPKGNSIKVNDKVFSILVVDDETTFRDSYKFNINNYAKKNNLKVTVDLASDGMQAMIQIFKNSMLNKSYDAIIVDYNMEYLRGNEIGFILRSSIDKNENNASKYATNINVNQYKNKTQQIPKSNYTNYLVSNKDENKLGTKTLIFLATAESETDHLINYGKIKVIDEILTKINIKADVEKLFTSLLNYRKTK